MGREETVDAFRKGVKKNKKKRGVEGGKI